MTARPRPSTHIAQAGVRADRLPEDDTIEQGKRLLLVDDRGLSLTERLANHFYRLTWNTPLHAMRLKGNIRSSCWPFRRSSCPATRARARRCARAISSTAA